MTSKTYILETPITLDGSTLQRSDMNRDNLRAHFGIAHYAIANINVFHKSSAADEETPPITPEFFLSDGVTAVDETNVTSAMELHEVDNPETKLTDATTVCQPFKAVDTSTKSALGNYTSTWNSEIDTLATSTDNLWTRAAYASFFNYTTTSRAHSEFGAKEMFGQNYSTNNNLNAGQIMTSIQNIIAGYDVDTSTNNFDLRTILVNSIRDQYNAYKETLGEGVAQEGDQILQTGDVIVFHFEKLISSDSSQTLGDENDTTPVTPFDPDGLLLKTVVSVVIGQVSVDQNSIANGDGYIADADVTIRSPLTWDILYNTKTDENGFLNANTSWGLVLVECTGGTDISTNDAFDGTQSALVELDANDADTRMCSPITSLVVEDIIDDLETKALSGSPLTLTELRSRISASEETVANSLSIAKSDIKVNYLEDYTKLDLATKATSIAAAVKLITAQLRDDANETIRPKMMRTVKKSISRFISSSITQNPDFVLDLDNASFVTSVMDQAITISNMSSSVTNDRKSETQKGVKNLLSSMKKATTITEIAKINGSASKTARKSKQQRETLFQKTDAEIESDFDAEASAIATGIVSLTTPPNPITASFSLVNAVDLTTETNATALKLAIADFLQIDPLTVSNINVSVNTEYTPSVTQIEYTVAPSTFENTQLTTALINTLTTERIVTALENASIKGENTTVSTISPQAFDPIIFSFSVNDIRNEVVQANHAPFINAVATLSGVDASKISIQSTTPLQGGSVTTTQIRFAIASDTLDEVESTLSSLDTITHKNIAPAIGSTQLTAISALAETPAKFNFTAIEPQPKPIQFSTSIRGVNQEDLLQNTGPFIVAAQKTTGIESSAISIKSVVFDSVESKARVDFSILPKTRSDKRKAEAKLTSLDTETFVSSLASAETIIRAQASPSSSDTTITSIYNNTISADYTSIQPPPVTLTAVIDNTTILDEADRTAKESVLKNAFVAALIEKGVSDVHENDVKLTLVEEDGDLVASYEIQSPTPSLAEDAKSIVSTQITTQTLSQHVITSDSESVFPDIATRLTNVASQPKARSVSITIDNASVAEARTNKAPLLRALARRLDIDHSKINIDSIEAESNAVDTIKIAFSVASDTQEEDVHVSNNIDVLTKSTYLDALVNVGSELSNNTFRYSTVQTVQQETRNDPVPISISLAGVSADTASPKSVELVSALQTLLNLDSTISVSVTNIEDDGQGGSVVNYMVTPASDTDAAIIHAFPSAVPVSDVTNAIRTATQLDTATVAEVASPEESIVYSVALNSFQYDESLTKSALKDALRRTIASQISEDESAISVTSVPTLRDARATFSINPTVKTKKEITQSLVTLTAAQLEDGLHSTNTNTQSITVNKIDNVPAPPVTRTLQLGNMTTTDVSQNQSTIIMTLSNITGVHPAAIDIESISVDSTDNSATSVDFVIFPKTETRRIAVDTALVKLDSTQLKTRLIETHETISNDLDSPFSETSVAPIPSKRPTPFPVALNLQGDSNALTSNDEILKTALAGRISVQVDEISNFVTQVDSTDNTVQVTFDVSATDIETSALAVTTLTAMTTTDYDDVISAAINDEVTSSITTVPPSTVSMTININGITSTTLSEKSNSNVIRATVASIMSLDTTSVAVTQVESTATGSKAIVTIVPPVADINRVETIRSTITKEHLYSSIVSTAELLDNESDSVFSSNTVSINPEIPLPEPVELTVSLAGMTTFNSSNESHILALKELVAFKYDIDTDIITPTVTVGESGALTVQYSIQAQTQEATRSLVEIIDTSPPSSLTDNFNSTSSPNIFSGAKVSATQTTLPALDVSFTINGIGTSSISDDKTPIVLALASELDVPATRIELVTVTGQSDDTVKITASVLPDKSTEDKTLTKIATLDATSLVNSIESFDTRATYTDASVASVDPLSPPKVKMSFALSNVTSAKVSDNRSIVKNAIIQAIDGVDSADQIVITRIIRTVSGGVQVEYEIKPTTHSNATQITSNASQLTSTQFANALASTSSGTPLDAATVSSVTPVAELIQKSITVSNISLDTAKENRTSLLHAIATLTGAKTSDVQLSISTGNGDTVILDYSILAEPTSTRSIAAATATLTADEIRTAVVNAPIQVDNATITSNPLQNMVVNTVSVPSIPKVVYTSVFSNSTVTELTNDETSLKTAFASASSIDANQVTVRYETNVLTGNVSVFFDVAPTSIDDRSTVTDALRTLASSTFQTALSGTGSTLLNTASVSQTTQPPDEADLTIVMSNISTTQTNEHQDIILESFAETVNINVSDVSITQVQDVAGGTSITLLAMPKTNASHVEVSTSLKSTTQTTLASTIKAAAASKFDSASDNVFVNVEVGSMTSTSIDLSSPTYAPAPAPTPAPAPAPADSDPIVDSNFTIPDPVVGTSESYAWSSFDEIELSGTSVGATAIAVSGNETLLLASSSLVDHEGITRAGRVDIYRKSGNTWVLDTTMYGSAAYNRLGASIAVNYSGSVIAITGTWTGAYDSTDDRVLTRVYGDVDSTWSLIGSEFSEQFDKLALSNSGSTLICANSSDRGRVFVYDFNDVLDEWQKVGDIDGSTIQNIDYFHFGVTLALSGDGDVAVIGAYNSNGSGAAYIARRNGASQWTVNSNELPYTADSTQVNYGVSSPSNNGNGVAISDDGTIVAVSTPMGSVTDASGLVEVFQYQGTQWTLRYTLQSNDLESQFGHVVSLSGDGRVLAAISPTLDKVRVVTFDTNTWTIVSDTTITKSQAFETYIALSKNAGTLAASYVSSGTSSVLVIEPHVSPFVTSSGTFNAIPNTPTTFDLRNIVSVVNNTALVTYDITNSSPQKGNVTLNGSILEYTANLNASGVDTFQVTVVAGTVTQTPLIRVDMTPVSIDGLTGPVVFSFNHTSSQKTIDLPFYGPSTSSPVFTIDGGITYVRASKLVGLVQNQSYTVQMYVPDDPQVGLSFFHSGLSQNTNTARLISNSTLNITAFNGVRLSSAGDQFRGLTGSLSATDAPSIPENTSLNSAFRSSTITSIDLSSWNVSKCIDATFMFQSCTQLGNDNGSVALDHWNLSNCSSVANMFEGAFGKNVSGYTAGTVSIAGWTLGSATNQIDMSSMFKDATGFDGDLSGWTVHTDTANDVFDGTVAYTGQGVSTWTVSAVSDVVTVESLHSENSWTIPELEGPMVFSFITDPGETSVLLPYYTSIETLLPTYSLDGGTTRIESSSITGLVENTSYTVHMYLPTTSQIGVSFNHNGTTLMSEPKLTLNTSTNVSAFNGIRLADVGSQFKNFSGTLDFAVPPVLAGSLSLAFSGLSDYATISNIGMLDTSNVTSLYGTFKNASVFNQNLNSWNTSNVTTMYEVFRGASAFDQDVGQWDVSKVTDVRNMFMNSGMSTTNYSNTLVGWTDTTNATPKVGVNASGMGHGIAYSIDSISARDTLINTYGWTISGDAVASFAERSALSSAVNAWIADPVNAETTYGHISTWNTSHVTDMSELFKGISTFNDDISSWNTSNVTDMGQMFRSASAFNQDISGWNTSNVTDMELMFYEASAFNRDIGSWNTSNVTNMNSMFNGATNFGVDNAIDFSYWDVSNVENIFEMFRNAGRSNDSTTGGTLTIDGWNLAACTNMKSSFMGAFNSFTSINLRNWTIGSSEDTTYTPSMESLFHHGNLQTHTDLSGWKLYNVTNTEFLFNGNNEFTGNGILTWRISNSIYNNIDSTTDDKVFVNTNVSDADQEAFQALFTPNLVNMSTRFALTGVNLTDLDATQQSALIDETNTSVANTLNVDISNVSTTLSAGSILVDTTISNVHQITSQSIAVDTIVNNLKTDIAQNATLMTVIPQSSLDSMAAYPIQPEPEPTAVAIDWDTSQNRTFQGTVNGEYFGFNVIVSGNGQVCAISSVRWTNDYKGRLFLYRYQEGPNGYDGTWTQEFTLQGTLMHNEVVATSLNYDGTRVVVSGRARNQGELNQGRHKTRVFEYANGSWSQLGDELAQSTTSSMSDDGNIVVIGSHTGYSNYSYGGRGDFHIYEWNGSSWELKKYVHGKDIRNNNQLRYGIHVKISGDGQTALIKMYNDNRGGVHVYRRQTDGSWISEISPNNQVVNNHILSSIPYPTDSSKRNIGGDGLTRGMDINSDGSIIAIGIPTHNNLGTDPGIVLIFEYAEGNWIQRTSITRNVNSDDFGLVLELSSDGKKIFISDRINKKIYVYIINDDWTTTLVKELTSTGSSFGRFLEIDSDGGTLIATDFFTLTDKGNVIITKFKVEPKP